MSRLTNTTIRLAFYISPHTATGWIRNKERYIYPKQKAVLKVIKIIKSRGEVDTPLKQVSAEERKLKKIEAEKNDKAVAFLDLSNPKSN
jgi:translation initiation factor 2 alpha subunit (eIF-2alpha)